ncbi:iron-siderophore ABC transporter substrate-binding protein [Chlorogloeopsis sp. ULAP02]|uniref:iron-siderophore ABC transporter substrate-binding protein n=1 Tax=Chlorogloeopsis sp. ULAP02 TaxID=3107926 RepID=UPI003135FAD2
MIKRIGSAIILFLFVGLTIILIKACDDRFTESSTNINRLSSASECRIVQHTMGETCVPKNPERVATIFHGTLGNTLALGVKPIASSVVDMQNPFPAYLKDKVKGIEILGSQNEPNLEKILMFKPDLILVWQNIQAIYPLLSQISPTAIVPWRGPAAWREHFEFVTKALRKEAEAQQAWKHYYQRIDELKLALGSRYQNKEISVVVPSIHWGFFIQAKNSFAGSILNDLKLPRPKLQDVNTSSGYVTFTSEEELGMIDGDIIFVLTSKNDEREAFEKILQKPLGKRLKAVQRGHIYFVDTLAWIGSNLLAADVVIDDLFKYLINAP